jgi:hypothetical protein
MILDAQAESDPPPFRAPDFAVEPEPEHQKSLIGTVVVVAVVLAVVGTWVVINRSAKSNPGPVALYAPPSPGATPASWAPTAPEPAKPIPVVNYQPRVSWDGPSDLEHFEEPQVDISSVSDMTTEQVKTTVFKNRIVKLRVVINTEGEINEVETISGHPILVEAATASAKRSIFRSRSKPTSRILTYTFRVLND